MRARQIRGLPRGIVNEVMGRRETPDFGNDTSPLSRVFWCVSHLVFHPEVLGTQLHHNTAAFESLTCCPLYLLPPVVHPSLDHACLVTIPV